MSIVAKRIRRPATEVRAAAIAAARGLLLADGPGAVTLKAVAAELGMGHANLLHHFGTAAGLQAAVMEAMIAETIARVQHMVAHVRAGEAAPRAIVDLVFDAHDRHGLARLTAWLTSTGEAHRLEPLFAGLADLVNVLESGAPMPADQARRRITDIALLLILTSLGDALIGPTLHAALGDAPGRARDLVTEALLRQLVHGG